MSTLTTHPTPSVTPAPEPAPAATPHAQSGRAGRLAGGLVNWIIGAAGCMFWPTAIFVVGWTYRRMRRSAVAIWNRSSANPIVPEPRTPWLVHRREGRTLRNLLAPVWWNAKTGVQGVFNSYVLTAPACIAWLVAWRFGWDNSFHKMYEQAYIGPSVWFFGAFLFIAAMLYVPLAQARQAVTGDWRAFYGFRVVWALLRRRPVRWVFLAAAYALLSIPIYVFAAAPSFIHQAGGLEARPDEELILWLYGYWALAALVLFPAYYALRRRATRLYARALPGAIRRGEVPIDRLHPYERDTLGRLGLLIVDEPKRRHPVVAAMGWTSGRFGRIATGTLAFLLWMTVVMQVFVSNFVNYSDRRWVVQPLVQLPWMTQIPSHLTDPPTPGDATDMGPSATGA